MNVILDQIKVRSYIDCHNKNIDDFFSVDLQRHFGSDKITAAQWFEAQQLIQKQNFYEKGRTILIYARMHGYNVKMCMQSNKLIWDGSLIEEATI